MERSSAAGTIASVLPAVPRAQRSLFGDASIVPIAGSGRALRHDHDRQLARQAGDSWRQPKPPIADVGSVPLRDGKAYIMRCLMTDGDRDRLLRRVAELDTIIRCAREAQYTDMPTEIASLLLRDDPILRWDLSEFVAAYEAGKRYPADRLPNAVDRLIDAKLQFYFVAQVLPATQNVMVYGRGFNPARPLDTPALQLARRCYTQAMIGQSRILWERLMRLIYYLEEGSDPTGKSTRRPFFRKLKDWSPRWDVLAEWQTELDRYGDQYRTPEYHSGSVLKRELLGGPVVDPNDVLSLLTPVMNGIWPVLIANVRGDPHHIVTLGRKVRPGKRLLPGSHGLPRGH